MSDLSKLQSWKNLEIKSRQISKISLNQMFKEDKDRFKKYSITIKDLLFDYSKNHIDKNLFQSFVQLLNDVDLNRKIKALFNGEKINSSEDRPVMHFLLRGSYNSKTKNIYNNTVKKCLIKMKSFYEDFKDGKIGVKKIKNIINIGIGGSDLGPKMVCNALEHYSKNQINIFFISNIDPNNMTEVLKKLDPEESIFIISSKSFGTIETLKNGLECIKWFNNKSKSNFSEHFFAVTSNIEKAKSFGIKEKNIFPIWDWVGGRYSFWSAVGLPIMLKIGYNNFLTLLKGAKDIDYHFQNEPFDKNIPVILACIGIIYNNFFKCETQAILPYDEYLKYLPMYLQQADMESNGKSISNDSKKVKYQTGPIIWGDIGTNGQHAFFQLIHQGTKYIPCDFIGFSKSNNEKSDLHEILLSNLIGQTSALMKGKTLKEAQIEVNDKKKKSNYKILLNSKLFEGNKPSTTILFNKLNPYNLGRLIAIYEHKIFVQGCIWNINSFDQWGVELGKELANKIHKIFKSKDFENIDSSSKGQLDFILKTRSS